MKYEVTLYTKDYVNVDGKYHPVEIKTKYIFRDWEDVQCALAYLVEGSEKGVKSEIKFIKEEV